MLLCGPAAIFRRPAILLFSFGMPPLASAAINLGFRVSEHQISDAQIDRARIDGGFSFALAAFILGLGLLAVLNRVGMPDDMLRGGLFVLLFCGLLVVVLWRRTMRLAEFYAGGRVLPAVYAGMAFAGLSLALVLPFLAPSLGLNFGSIVIGAGFGALWLLFVNGPALRKNGAYSFADIIAARFPLAAIRIGIVLLSAFCSLCLALGGIEIAVHGLGGALGLERVDAIILVGGLLIILIVPAGLSGVMWIAVAATVVAVTAMLLPLLAGFFTSQPQATPLFGDQKLWSRALSDIAVLTGSDTTLGPQLSLIIVFALGIPALTPMLSGAIASRDEVSAWRSGISGSLWLLIGGVLIAGTLGSAALTLEIEAANQLPANLPGAIFDASERGAIAICGVHSGDAATITRACAFKIGTGRALRLQDISSDGTDLVTSLPVLRGSEPTLARLASAITIMLGLGLAASAIQSFITSLGHDLVRPARRRLGPVSRRLAVARAMAVGLVVLGGFRLSGHAIDVRVPFLLAVALSAGFVAPLAFLSSLRRMTSLGAAAALCVAGFVMAHYFLVKGWSSPLHELATDSSFAAVDAVVVGLFVAFLPKWKPAKPAPAAADETKDVIMEEAPAAPALAPDAHIGADEAP
jgi:cation/acetate symporter